MFSELYILELHPLTKKYGIYDNNIKGLAFFGNTYDLEHIYEYKTLVQMKKILNLEGI